MSEPMAAAAEAQGTAAPYVHPEAVARVALADDTTYQRVAELFGSLASPTRVKIVHALLHQELSTSDLALVVGVTEAGVSQHLRLLRALHVVKARRAGRFVYYTLDDTHVALLMQLGLAHQGHAQGHGQGLAERGGASEWDVARTVPQDSPVARDGTLAQTTETEAL